jgi:lysophospholipase L1-like esterase
MRKEHWLLVGSVTLTLLVALLLLRWLAPQLIGLPVDLTLVRSSREVPPYYANVFERNDAVRPDGFLLNDPVMLVRAPPLYPDGNNKGPHDILGFRNRAVPTVADLVTIGDSQTYGNNASLEQSWPGWMGSSLKNRDLVIYNMSTGGWSAPQYLKAFEYAARFQPNVVIVAFYSGNDATESFTLAYGNENWGFLRPDLNLKASDVPAVIFPTPESETWKVHFKDGSETIFVPKLRYTSNDRDHRAVRAGWSILSTVAARLASEANKRGIKLILTIVPTKELAYARKVAIENLAPPEEYRALVAAEAANITDFAKQIKALSNVHYVDLIEPLQLAVLKPSAYYPPSRNGHPLAAGYKVIAEALYPVVLQLNPARPLGPVAVTTNDDKRVLLLTTREGVWRVTSTQVLAANGWKLGNVPVVTERDLAGKPFRGVLVEINPQRFGPNAVR